MTRKEEREQAAIAFQDSPAEDNINTIADFFICGAEWADKTMIDKACDWMSKHLPFEYEGFTDFIQAFKKAMYK